MNRDRIKLIRAAILRMERAMDLLEEEMECEMEVYDSLPECLRTAESGEQMQKYIECLSAVVENIGDVVDTLAGTIEEGVE